MAALLLAGCGGASRSTSRPAATTAATTQTSAAPAAPSTGELLSVPAVGRIYGHCRPGDARWTITFVNDSRASDGLVASVGDGQPVASTLQPGQSQNMTLVPGAGTSRQPADATTHTPAQTLRTTEPLTLKITQGTEPHIYRVQVRLTVAAAIGDTTDCALAGSRLDAWTFYPGGQPPS